MKAVRSGEAGREDRAAHRRRRRCPTAAAEKGAEEARRLLSGPITLRSGGKNVGKVQPKELAPALVIGECDAGACKVRIDADKLASAIRKRRQEAGARPRRRALARVTARKVRVVPAKNGLALHPIDTARLVRNAGLANDGAAHGRGRAARRPSPR